MKTAHYTQYGTAKVLGIKEVPIPQPSDDEILVRVHATTFSRSDCAIISGPWYMRPLTGLFKPKCTVSGTDFAGKIERVGKNITHLKVGARVFGFDDLGLRSHAAYMTLTPRKAIDVIPEHLSYVQAVACLEGVHYALNMINKVKLIAGQKAVVNGATGAIGSALLQLLKYKHLYVTATCSTPNVALIRSLGADRVIDFTKEDFTKDTDTYDYVFDAIGKSTFGQCKTLLKPTGIYISSELGPGAQNIFYALASLFIKGKKVIFPIPLNIKESITYIKKLLDEDKYKPVIDRQYALEDIQKAYAYAASGHKVGNAILLPHT